MINSNMELKTTAELAARPTPAVPFLQLYPLKHPTNPIANPKKNVLIVEGTTSLKSK